MQFQPTGFALWLDSTQLGSFPDVASALAAADERGRKTSGTYLITQAVVGLVMSKAYGVLAPASAGVVAPSTPQNPKLDSNTIGQITFHWDAASVGTYPLAGYQVYRNHIPYGTPTQVPSFTDNAVTAGQAESYQIAAFDDHGNNSPLSSALNVTAASATPATWGTVPAQQAITNQAFTLELSASVNNPNGLSLTYGVASGTLPTGLSLNAATGRVSGTPTAVGANTLTFSISDGINAPSNSAAAVFSVRGPDTLAPTVPSVPEYAVTSSEIDLTIDPSSDPTVANAIASGLAGIKVYRDGTLRSTIPTAAGVTGLATIQDVGTILSAGSGSQSGADFTLTGYSTDIYGTVDGMRMAWRQVTGDFNLISLVDFATAPLAFSKALLIFRADLINPAAIYAAAVRFSDASGNGVNFEYRLNAGASAQQVTAIPGITGIIPMKISRVGSVLTAYYWNGTKFATIGSASIPNMPSTCYLGAAVGAGGASAVTAIFHELNWQNLPRVTYQDTGLGAGQSHSYQLSAYDSAGNESAQSAALTVATLASTGAFLATSFGAGVSLSAFRGAYTSGGGGGWCDIQGTDALTGYNLTAIQNGSPIFGGARGTFPDSMQLIGLGANGQPDTDFTRQILIGGGYGSKNYLALTRVVPYTSSMQCSYVMFPDTSQPQGMIYHRSLRRFSANFASLISSCSFFSLAETKTGSNARICIQVNKYNVNKQGAAAPCLTVFTDHPPDFTRTPVSTNLVNSNGDSIINLSSSTPFLLEHAYRQSNDATKGFIWVAINGVQVFFYQGVTQTTATEERINRVFPFLCYNDATAGIEVDVTDFWIKGAAPGVSAWPSDATSHPQVA